MVHGMVKSLRSYLLTTMVLVIIALKLSVTLIVLKSITRFIISKSFMNIAYSDLSCKVTNNGIFTNRLLNFERKFLNNISSAFFLSLCRNRAGILIYSFETTRVSSIFEALVSTAYGVLLLSTFSSTTLASLHLTHLE